MRGLAATLAIALLATSAAPKAEPDHPFGPDVIRVPSSTISIAGAGATFPYPILRPKLALAGFENILFELQSSLARSNLSMS